ncbi:MAG TPA: delta-60 repeat domain-containing protein [Gaiellaceae bacterium]|nr:delta-60 repeat domain-containing protein [Gaiellaceae bacterium]
MFSIRRARLIASACVLAGLIAAVARAASEALDPSFSTDGVELIDFGRGSSDEATAVAIQEDGKIVTAGYGTRGGSSDFAVARNMPSGERDRSFGTAGRVLTDVADFSGDFGEAVAIQEDGKIVVAGWTNFGAGGSSDFVLARYRKSGVLDPTFGNGGMVLSDLGSASSDHALAVAIQDNGKIVVAGDSDAGGGRDFAVARYTRSGTLDPDFGAGGIVLTDLGSAVEDVAHTVAIQRDGQIVVAGESGTGSGSDFALARYSRSGALDSDFGTGGKVVTDLGSSSRDVGRAVAIQQDGRIVVAGWRMPAGGSSDFALTRYRKNGALDSSFGPGGVVLSDLLGFDLATAVAIQPDGKILAAGGSDAGRGSDFAVARYTTTGALDATYGTGGAVTTDLGAKRYDFAFDVAVQADGKIVVAGFSYAGAGGGSSDNFGVARYLP